jgi:hypothetical protein
MSDKTQSGYEVTITVWIPCDVRQPATMTEAANVIGRLPDMPQTTLPGYTTQFVVGEPRWIARRKITPSVRTGSDTAVSAAQEPAGDGVSSPPTPAGDDDMPGFLKR